MYQLSTFQLEDRKSFEKKLISWIASRDTVSLLHSCGNSDSRYSRYSLIVAVDSVAEDEVSQFSSLNRINMKDWRFGYISYDVKNHIEELQSHHPDFVLFPEVFFFKPKYILILEKENVHVYSLDTLNKAQRIVEEIQGYDLPIPRSYKTHIQSRFSKQEYLDTVKKLQQHIAKGDIYEINFCQEFYSQDIDLNPEQLFALLIERSPMPFAAFFKHKSKYLICASPERFIQKSGDSLISQPIKGTIKRGKDTKEDQALIRSLEESQKERAENMMTIDVTRNDLARIAHPGSVHTDEICGVYTFDQLHQMISTVRAVLPPDYSFSEIIKHTFPMASMTGAPKIRAMKLIEKYERSKRGLFSGTIGYISPNGDFDFNVIIRSILYNQKDKYLSLSVGSAITALSDPEKEYEECLLKAKAMMEILNTN